MKTLVFFVSLILLTITTGVAVNSQDVQKKGQKQTLKVTSTAFSEGGMIPKLYSCDGKSISPPLAWSGVPSGTKSFAVIADDPDAPGMVFVHWVVYNMPASTTALSESMADQKQLDDGTRQGLNDFLKIGFGGLCPPTGTHRYYFKVYALDAMLDLEPGQTKQHLLKAMEGHVLAEGQLMGRYKR